MIFSIVLALVIFYYGIPLALWAIREAPITSALVVIIVSIVLIALAL